MLFDVFKNGCKVDELQLGMIERLRMVARVGGFFAGGEQVGETGERFAVTIIIMLRAPHERGAQQQPGYQPQNAARFLFGA